MAFGLSFSRDHSNWSKATKEVRKGPTADDNLTRSAQKMRERRLTSTRRLEKRRYSRKAGSTAPGGTVLPAMSDLMIARNNWYPLLSQLVPLSSALSALHGRAHLYGHVRPGA